MRSFRSVALALILAPTVFGAGCVVRYQEVRPAEPLPPPADFVEVEQRLVDLIDDVEDVDKRDRIDAALDLLRLGQTMDPEPQARVLAYLQRVVGIEERSLPMEAPAIFDVPKGNEGHIVAPGGWLGPRIDEEDLGGVEELEPEPEQGDTGVSQPDAPVAPGDGLDGTGDDAEPVADAPAPGEAPPLTGPGTDPVDQARSALAAGDPAGALAALEPCERIGCGDDLEQVWAQARDAFVHLERERAGELFLAARGEADAVERKRRLDEALDLLTGLLDRYPDADEADAIRRNIDTVSAELETLR